MRMRGRFLVGVAAAILFWVPLGASPQRQDTAAATPATTAPAAPEGQPDFGRALFTRKGCYQCHANEAQGGPAGPRLGPGPLPFTAFRAYVRRPAGEMPPYTTKVLTDRELADIHAFLRSLPQPPAAAAVPLLRP